MYTMQYACMLTNFTLGLSNPDIDASERFKFSLSAKVVLKRNVNYMYIVHVPVHVHVLHTSTLHVCM